MPIQISRASRDAITYDANAGRLPDVIDINIMFSTPSSTDISYN